MLNIKGKLIATSGTSLWLIDIGDGNGRVLDAEAHMVTEPIPIGSITKSGYWDGITQDEEVDHLLPGLLQDAIEVDLKWNPINK